jgi:hypothetical protein
MSFLDAWLVGGLVLLVVLCCCVRKGAETPVTGRLHPRSSAALQSETDRIGARHPAQQRGDRSETSSRQAAAALAYRSPSQKSSPPPFAPAARRQSNHPPCGIDAVDRVTGNLFSPLRIAPHHPRRAQLQSDDFRTGLMAPTEYCVRICSAA